MGEVYSYFSASNIERRRQAHAPNTRQPRGSDVTIPTTAAQMIATLLDQAKGRTLAEREVRAAHAFLLGDASRHPSARRRS